MACGSCGSSKTYTLQLIDRIQHNDTTVSFEFAGLEQFTWQEGCSSKLYLPIDGVLQGRQFAYVTLPEEKIVRFTSRMGDERSPYKEHLHDLHIGDLVEVSQPGGNFALRRSGRPVLLLSNGVGIAAFRGSVKSFEKNQVGVNQLTLINMDKTGNLFKEEFDGVAQRINSFKSIYVDHRDDFFRQLDLESQNLMFSTGYVPLFHVVGSEDFLLDVTAYLMSVGFDEADIVTDSQSSGCGGCACS